MSESLRELLADYSHMAWSGWMVYMFSKGKITEITTEGGSKTVVWQMPQWAIERWTRQMQTAYSRLSETEKASDLAEADKIIEIVDRHLHLSTSVASIPPREFKVGDDVTVGDLKNELRRVADMIKIEINHLHVLSGGLPISLELDDNIRGSEFIHYGVHLSVEVKQRGVG